ncbi:hypothetical protein IFM89_020240, partial [Coptis chinensis]
MDIKERLTKDLTNRLETGSSFYVTFKYEKLDIFCYFCGVIDSLGMIITIAELEHNTDMISLSVGDPPKISNRSSQACLGPISSLIGKLAKAHNPSPYQEPPKDHGDSCHKHLVQRENGATVQNRAVKDINMGEQTKQGRTDTVTASDTEDRIDKDTEMNSYALSLSTPIGPDSYTGLGLGPYEMDGVGAEDMDQGLQRVDTLEEAQQWRSNGGSPTRDIMEEAQESMLEETYLMDDSHLRNPAANMIEYEEQDGAQDGESDSGAWAGSINQSEDQSVDMSISSGYTRSSGSGSAKGFYNT